MAHPTYYTYLLVNMLCNCKFDVTLLVYIVVNLLCCFSAYYCISCIMVIIFVTTLSTKFVVGELLFPVMFEVFASAKDIHHYINIIYNKS